MDGVLGVDAKGAVARKLFRVLKVFELVLLLTNGGPGVQTSILAFEIYRQAFRLNDIGYAAALSVFLFALVLTISGVVWQLRRKLVFHEAE